MKSKQKKNKKFKGFDYVELMDRWGLKQSNDAFDRINGEKLQGFLRNTMDSQNKNKMSKIAKDIREFAIALSGEEEQLENSCCHFWLGLSNIEDNYNLIRITIPLIPYMWTQLEGTKMRTEIW